MKKLSGKKLLVLLAVLCVVVGGAYAIWAMLGEDTVEMSVTSTAGELELTIPFVDNSMDVTGGSDAMEQSVQFNNPNGMTSVSIDFVDVATDVDTDECTNWEDDCYVSISSAADGGTFYNKSQLPVEVPMPSGANGFKAKLECVASSCPQSHEVTLLLTQVV